MNIRCAFVTRRPNSFLHPIPSPASPSFSLLTAPAPAANSASPIPPQLPAPPPCALCPFIPATTQHPFAPSLHHFPPIPLRNLRRHPSLRPFSALAPSPLPPNPPPRFPATPCTSGILATQRLPRIHRPAGFTLVELLVALALLSLLVVSLFSLVDAASKLWKQSEASVESTREARAALEKIASELRSAYIPAPALFRLEDPGTPTSRLLFLTHLPTSAQKSGERSHLCAVAYFLAKGRVSDIGAASREESWHLYRYLLESNDTARALLENPSSPNLWPPDELTPMSPRAEILARNVRSFRITPFVRSGASLAPWLPASNSPPDLLLLQLETLNTNAARAFRGDIRQDHPALLKQIERWQLQVPLHSSSPN